MTVTLGEPRHRCILALLPWVPNPLWKSKIYPESGTKKLLDGFWRKIRSWTILSLAIAKPLLNAKMMRKAGKLLPNLMVQSKAPTSCLPLQNIFKPSAFCTQDVSITYVLRNWRVWFSEWLYNDSFQNQKPIAVIDFLKNYKYTIHMFEESNKGVKEHENLMAVCHFRSISMIILMPIYLCIAHSPLCEPFWIFAPLIMHENINKVFK